MKRLDSLDQETPGSPEEHPRQEDQAGGMEAIEQESPPAPREFGP
jgi:hypothetical protein